MMYLVLFFLLAFSPPALAVTRYADGQVSGTCLAGNYSVANRNCLGSDGDMYGGVFGLQNALNASAPGDTVIVRSFTANGGIYRGTGRFTGVDVKSGSSFGTNCSNCTYIQGYGGAASSATAGCGEGECPRIAAIVGTDLASRQFVFVKNVIIDGSTVNGIGINGVNFSRFENVTVRDNYSFGVNGVTDLQLINMSVHGNGFRANAATECGGFCHGAYTGDGSNFLFDGGQYWGNHGFGIQAYANTTNSVFRNLKIYQNGATGMIVTGTNNLVYNLLIYGNGTRGSGNGLHLNTVGMAAYNITSYNNAGYGICIDAGSVTVRNALVIGNRDGQIVSNACNPPPATDYTASSVQTNNITTGTAASHFVNASTGDFRLVSGSPATNQGTNLSLIFTTDVERASRPPTGAWSIGAYQFGGVVGPTVNITSPTTGATHIATSSPIALAGTASSGVSLSQVTWTNSAGGSGTAAGLGNWSIPSIALFAGSNVITVTVTDSLGNTGQDVLTVTYTPVSEQVVAAWSCNEGAGSTVADSSGNANSGTFTSPVWVAGMFGSACSFNGSTAVVTVADSASLDLTAGVTITAWMHPTAITSTWRTLLGKGENYFLYASSVDRCGSGAPYGGYFDGSVYPSACSSVIPAINTWTFVALTFNGSQVQMYTGTTTANLTLRESTATTVSMTANAGSLFIGRSDFGGEAFQGYLDEIRIYNYGRSAAVGSGSCGSSPLTGAIYSQLQCDMITPIIPGGSIIIQLNVTALQLGPGVILEMGAVQ